MREKIYSIIEPLNRETKLSAFYDFFMIVSILTSLIPLAFKAVYPAFIVIDRVCAVIFIIDYVLRWITADYKYNKKGVVSFLRYPFSPMAIIDLISILPSLIVVNSGLKILRVLRMLRALRVFRVFKASRYSKSLRIISKVFKESKTPLIAVGTLAIVYILVSALIIVNVEPDSFENFFDAVYWATVSLTTVGYGDIYPITTLGRIVTMLSSVFGIAIVALPAGIITAGYMEELQKRKNGKEDHDNADKNNDAANNDGGDEKKDG